MNKIHLNEEVLILLSDLRSLVKRDLPKNPMVKDMKEIFLRIFGSKLIHKRVEQKIKFVYYPKYSNTLNNYYSRQLNNFLDHCINSKTVLEEDSDLIIQNIKKLSKKNSVISKAIKARNNHIELSKESYSEYKVGYLRELLEEKGIMSIGSKKKLVKRLEKWDEYKMYTKKYLMKYLKEYNMKGYSGKKKEDLIRICVNLK